MSSIRARRVPSPPSTAETPAPRASPPTRRLLPHATCARSQRPTRTRSQTPKTAPRRREGAAGSHECHSCTRGPTERPRGEECGATTGARAVLPSDCMAQRGHGGRRPRWAFHSGACGPTEWQHNEGRGLWPRRAPLRRGATCRAMLWRARPYRVAAWCGGGTRAPGLLGRAEETGSLTWCWCVLEQGSAAYWRSTSANYATATVPRSRREGCCWPVVGGRLT